MWKRKRTLNDVVQWHFPSESPAEDDPIREQLRELGAELVPAVGQEKDKGKNKSYHLKALAVMQCPWREVLYLVSHQSTQKIESSIWFRIPIRYLPVTQNTCLTLQIIADWDYGRHLITGRHQPTIPYGPSWVSNVEMSGKWRLVRCL